LQPERWKVESGVRLDVRATLGEEDDTNLELEAMIVQN
jgi:hypothetical protein